MAERSMRDQQLELMRSWADLIDGGHQLRTAEPGTEHDLTIIQPIPGTPRLWGNLDQPIGVGYKQMVSSMN